MSLISLIALQLYREGIKGREDGEKVNYSRAAIILSISIEGGEIIRGRRLIQGQLLFKDIRYLPFFPCPYKQSQTSL